jgi:hypothetical protein
MTPPILRGCALLIKRAKKKATVIRVAFDGYRIVSKPLFEYRGGSEGYRATRPDEHQVTGLRISAFAGLARTHSERPETRHLETPAFPDRFGDTLECSVDRLVRGELANVSAFGNSLD